MFKRPYHQRIALVLESMNPVLLSEHHCFFGGGTAIALRYGEYRESVDIDFLVSDLASYSCSSPNGSNARWEKFPLKFPARCR